MQSNLINDLRREAKTNSLSTHPRRMLLNGAAEALVLGDRLADYVRMHYEANPPMPESIAVAWRDYRQERGYSSNE